MVAPMRAHSQDSTVKPPWKVGVPTTTTPTQTGSVTSDTSFAREALVGNMVEVRLGSVARQKASDSRVKQFAEQMITDHTAMGKEWSKLAPKANGFEQVYSAAQQQELTQLEKLSGAQFDQAYMTAMIQDHQRDEQAYQSRGLSAPSPEVRQLATSGLNTIRQHLSMARQVGSAVGVSTSVATAPQTPFPRTATGRDTTFVERFPNRNADANRRRSEVTDTEFIQTMVGASKLEVSLAELAKRKASDKDVKHFAQNMANQFSDWEDRWTDLAARTDKSWKPAMGHLRQEKVDRVEKAAKGKNFDRAYMETVIDHFQALLPYLQKEGSQVQSSQARNLVQNELPTLRDNLSNAKRLGDRVGAQVNEPKNRSVSERR
jgi:putative membrane protein